MALSFPHPPTAGQQYVGDGVTYEYDGTLGAWVKLKPVQSALLGAAAQTGAAIIPGGDDAERAAITTPSAGMFRYNDQTAPAVMEYYDGTAWKTLSTGGGGGGGNVGQTWELLAMPSPVQSVQSFAWHPVNNEFGAICSELGGGLRLYTSPDGRSWTRGSFSLNIVGGFLLPGKGSTWLWTGTFNSSLTSYPQILPSLTGTPITMSKPGIGDTTSVGFCAASNLYVCATNNQTTPGLPPYYVYVYTSSDALTWTLAFSSAAFPGGTFTSPGVSWGISGNYIRGSFGGQSTGFGVPLVAQPVSVDGGLNWSLDPIQTNFTGLGTAEGRNEAYWANGYWFQTNYRGSGVGYNNAYQKTTTLFTGGTNIGSLWINPYTMTPADSNVSGNQGTGGRFWPNLNLYPTGGYPVVFPSNTAGIADIYSSVYGDSAGVGIMRCTGPYYYITPPA